MLADVALVAGAYLLGSVPFGVLVARAKGVDITRVGSGNIGATNVGRALGAKFGLLVFLLDVLKGVAPVALAGALNLPPLTRVLAAAAAFLGHLFPIYLRLRGGKGAATGIGTVFVLAPGPAALGMLAWLAVVASTRTVSLGSVAAAVTLAAAQTLAGDSLPVALYLWLGCLFVTLRHLSNLRRVLAGTESQMGDRPMFRHLAGALHTLSLGLWAGGVTFFTFLAAPAIFGALESAAAGSAVAPVFPRLFAYQAACAGVALVTASGFRKQPGRVHRLRVVLVALAALTVAAGWPLSSHVSELRSARLSPDPAVAAAAKAAFGPAHVASLFLSMATAGLTLAALALAARLGPEPTGEEEAGRGGVEPPLPA